MKVLAQRLLVTLLICTLAFLACSHKILAQDKHKETLLEKLFITKEPLPDRYIIVFADTNLADEESTQETLSARARELTGEFGGSLAVIKSSNCARSFGSNVKLLQLNISGKSIRAADNCFRESQSGWYSSSYLCQSRCRA